MRENEFLELLGFKTKNKTLYQKEYKLHGYVIKADTAKGKIFYRASSQTTTVERQADGQIQLGDKTTSNFSVPENFVVLECVDRLLRKGYHPNDIHLERRYPSGRGASGGKSDICVYGKDGKSLIVIECKTWGEEFEKEKKRMDEHGGQTFAYLANDQNAKFLVLYSSKFNKINDDGGKFEYENLIVQVKDREEDLKKGIKQIEEENIKLYRDAKNKSEYFEVWKESFNKYFHFNGIFDEDANAYSLELKALKKKNLKPLEDSQGLFNKFAEILRHNNISDNANAFNKILSLFLCKIVDEEKNEDEVLDFQVKVDEEYEHIIDRLQALYQKGMKKLNEEIIYYSEKDLHEIVKLYPKQTPIEQIELIFRELKYYTNNEFAFKEVHNKNLFIQNGRVLTEVIKLVQNFRFRFTSKQQVLGDFFELMLNHGVKQSEGQFFTPIPIVRYIIISLGYENIIRNKIAINDSDFLPKILDYACGAGHFLTESVEELQSIIKDIDYSKLSVELQSKIKEYKKSTEWAKDYIFGIEKDFRLARTSQIACYINGDGDANIIFGDGLEDHEQLQIQKKKFDLVVANPPYSVEAFKNYLNVGKTHFELFEHLSDRSSQIEALFIERTKQVLNVNGLAGIILPPTVLSNSGIYFKAREVLLKYFEIKAITELGSKTFIATQVGTIILFLKRRSDNFLKDREYIASDIFANTKYAIDIRYIDAARLLKMFIEYRGFEDNDYQRFLQIEINSELAETEMFKEYRNAFDSSTEIKQLRNKAYFKNYTDKEQESEIAKRFYFYCKEIEKEKFLYFMLCLSDGEKNTQTLENYYSPQQTVIVKTGKEIEDQREFLGYEFQGKKGQEGIKINSYGGKLFDENNYLNPERASSYVLKSISNLEISEVAETLQSNVLVHRTIDLIDFNKVVFDNTISLSEKKTHIIKSKYGLVRLGEICRIESGGTPDTNISEYWDGDINWATLVDTKQKYLYATQRKITLKGLRNSSAKLLPINTVIFSSRATIGEVTIAKVPTSTNQGYKNFICDEKKVDYEFLYYILKKYSYIVNDMASGMTYKEISKTQLSLFKIPLPPLKIQKQMVKELKELEGNQNKFLKKGVNARELEGIIKAEIDRIIVKYIE